MSTCYIVATPIGNLDDWSPRAIATLKSVDLIYAEDTRHSGFLLQKFGINTRCLSLHEHNERMRIDEIKAALANQQNIAIISDAGTPLISDPGFPLVRALKADHYEVIPIPGACALIAALSVSGIATNRFAFEGFLPAKKQARSEYLHRLKNEPRTLVFYESSHRIVAMLKDCCEAFTPDRFAFIGREMTKKYESYQADTLGNLLSYYTDHSDEVRGEFVLVVEGSSDENTAGVAIEAEQLLIELLAELPLKKAVALTAKLTGQPKNSLYQNALALQNNV